MIFSSDLETHENHVHQVLQQLLQNNLYVKAEKCGFHASSLTFLGFIVGEGTLSMAPGKVQAVWDWLRPETRKQLQRFLSFTNFYRQFIKNFISIAAPLHTLTSSQSHYLWNSSAETPFRTLKDKFTAAPVLKIPNPKLQFIAEVSASEMGIRTVLSQRSPKDKRLQPSAFLSRKLSPAE